MTNVLAAGYGTINLIRRDLEDVFDELPVPFRMRRDIELALEQAPSPIWLWRAIDQILDEYMPHPVLRRRVERVFDRALAYTNTMTRDPFIRGFGSHIGFGAYGDIGYRGFNDGYLRGFGYGDAYTRGFGYGYPYTRGFNDITTRGFGFDTWGRGFNDVYARGFGMGDTWNRTFDTFGTRGFGDTVFQPHFGNVGVNYFRNGLDELTPPVDVIEREHDILVRVNLPGVRELDVDTRITLNDVLTIRAVRRDGMLLTRAVPLPHVIDPTRVQAVFHNGVLEVCVAKIDATRFHRVPVGRDTTGTTFRTNGMGDHRAYVS